MGRRQEPNSKNQMKRDLAARIRDRILRILDTSEVIDANLLAQAEGFEDYSNMTFSIAFYVAMRQLPGLGQLTLSPIRGTGLYRVPSDQLAAIRVARKDRQSRRKFNEAIEEAKTLGRVATDIKVREFAHRRVTNMERQNLARSIVHAANKSKKQATARLQDLINTMRKKPAVLA